MLRPTRHDLQALSNLSRLPDWLEVAKLLAAERTATVDRLIDCQDEAVTKKLQGRAAFLTEFLKLVEGSSDQLAKLRQQ